MSLTPLTKRVILGIIAVTFLLIAEVIVHTLRRPERYRELVGSAMAGTPVPSTVTFLAFGDVNLGRTVGQKILKVDSLYPFRKYDIHGDSADIVFANLECQVSFQHGETGHPQYNLIFTAPPEAVAALKYSGITIVSTANNHAMDYGIGAALETIDRLTAANIPFVGTSKSKDSLYEPLKFEKNNIKFAIFGVTSFVNMTFAGWKDHVARPDTAILKERIRSIRDSVDIIIMSYHGGVEYTDNVAGHVAAFAEWSVRNGADIFLGHHPHVTFGLQKVNGRFIVHSLGNFVFYQPQHYWTQRSYGVKFRIDKQDTRTAVTLERLIPVDVSMQTRPMTDSTEIVKLQHRTQQLSNFDLSTYWK